MLNLLQIDNLEAHRTQRPFASPLTKYRQNNIIKPRKPKGKVIITPLFDHNNHKFSILLSTFNTFKTSQQIAEDTYNELTDTFYHHKRNTHKLVYRLSKHFTHPYLERYRRKGKTVGHKGFAYRCTPKGRRVCCELFYRMNEGISLHWRKTERRYGGGKTKRKNHYNIVCRDDGNCQECEYNPITIIGQVEVEDKKSDVV